MSNDNNTGDKPQRLFIAIESDNEIKRRIAALQQKLACSGADVKWVNPDNAHLTLVFFGDTPPGKAGQIQARMNEAAQNFSPFQIILRGIGCFGSQKHPRVVWAKVLDPERKLERLQLALREAVRGLAPKVEADRDSSPHLTIGRPRSSRNADELVALITKNQDFSLGSLTVSRMALMRSELTPAGPRYTLIHTAPQ